VVADGDSLWAVLIGSNDIAFAQVNSATNVVTSSLVIDSDSLLADFAIDSHGLWVYDTGGLYLFDPNNGHMIGQLQEGGGGAGITIGFGSVWFATSDHGGALLRIAPAA
jgi:hypothetical protein